MGRIRCTVGPCSHCNVSFQTWVLSLDSSFSFFYRETNNFVPIIKQNIIFKIYEMTKIVTDHEDCTQCNDVSELKPNVVHSL